MAMLVCDKCLKKIQMERDDMAITQSYAKDGKCDECHKFQKNLTEISTFAEIGWEELR